LVVICSTGHSVVVLACWLLHVAQDSIEVWPVGCYMLHRTACQSVGLLVILCSTGQYRGLASWLLYVAQDSVSQSWLVGRYMQHRTACHRFGLLVVICSTGQRVAELACWCYM
jgi:hypothetical protein